MKILRSVAIFCFAILFVGMTINTIIGDRKPSLPQCPSAPESPAVYTVDEGGSLVCYYPAVFTCPTPVLSGPTRDCPTLMNGEVTYDREGRIQSCIWDHRDEPSRADQLEEEKLRFFRDQEYRRIAAENARRH